MAEGEDSCCGLPVKAGHRDKPADTETELLARPVTDTSIAVRDTRYTSDVS
jgi:hypothetical protein